LKTKNPDIYYLTGFLVLPEFRILRDNLVAAFVCISHTQQFFHTFAFAMPVNKQSGKGKKSQRRNGGKKGRQHNVGGSQPSEDVPASAGGNSSPFPADNNADLQGVIVDTVPSQEDNADEGPSNVPVPAKRRLFRRSENILPKLMIDLESTQPEIPEHQLPNNLTGKVIKSVMDVVDEVRSNAADHNLPNERLMYYIDKLHKLLKDNKHVKPSASYKHIFCMVMAEAKRLHNSLQKWSEYGWKKASQNGEFDGHLRRSLEDSESFARVRALQARKAAKVRMEQQERNSARKVRRAAAKEREEKERVEREERQRLALERTEKERVEREARLAEKLRLAVEELEHKESTLRDRLNKTLQQMNGVNITDSESSEDDEGPSVPVQDPAHKWLRQPAVQTDSPGSISKGGRGIKGRMSSEARRKLRKAAKSSRPDSPDEGCGGFGDDIFGGDDDFGIGYE
jgi:hypothetical protein